MTQDRPGWLSVSLSKVMPPRIRHPQNQTNECYQFKTVIQLSKITMRSNQRWVGREKRFKGYRSHIQPLCYKIYLEVRNQVIAASQLEHPTTIPSHSMSKETGSRF